MEKRNRVIIQKEAVTNNSLLDSFYILIKGLDEAKTEIVDEPEPANDLNTDLKGSSKPEPKAVYDFFTSKKDKKDKKKKGKLADLRPS